MTAAESEEPPPRLHAVPDVAREPRHDHDYAAEQIVLGAMMLSEVALDAAAEIVKAADFYKPGHIVLFSAILGQRANAEPSDPAAIVHVLSISGDLGKVGGAEYVHDLIEAVPTAANAGWYANVVAEHAQWRDLGRAGIRIAQMVNEHAIEIDEARNRAEQFLLEATVRRERRESSRWKDIVGPAIDAVEAAGTRTGQLGMSTGIIDLDKMVNGLRAGQLVILGGRPAMGKSIFAIDIARHTSMRHGIRTAVFSLEMSRPEIANRILAAEARIALRDLENGKLTDTEWSRLARFDAEMRNAPLDIDDSPNMNLAEIRSKVRGMHRREAIGLVVVDYLQLMSSTGRSENRSLEVAELSRGLKLLAKEIGCPVIAASQLNRNSDGRADKRPQLTDLRESGGIENDADIVILLHRDSYYDAKKRPGEIDLIVAKNRNGPMGVVVASAQLHYTRIVDFAMPAS